MNADPPPANPPDPALAQEQDQAQASLVANLQKQTQGDMAGLMARYGTQLAMAGASTTSPLSTGTTLPAASFTPLGAGR